MKGTVNRNSIIQIWLVSYLLVLIIPLAVSFMLYSTAMSVTRQNMATINTIALSQTEIAIDQIFSDVYAAGRRILNQEAIASLMYAEEPLTSFKREKIGKLQETLREYTAHNDYFRSIYVYFSRGGFAATTQGLYRKDFLMEELEREAGAPSPAASWLGDGRQFQVYMAQSRQSSRADKIIVIMSDAPKGMAPDVVCIFVMDFKAVYALLDSYENEGGEKSRYIWLLSPAEHRLLCPDASFRFAGELGIDFSADSGYMKALETRNMAVTALTSGMTGWTIISAIPVRQYARELIRIRRVYIIFLFICLVAGMLISVIFAQKNYTPVRKLSRIYETEIDRQRALLAENNLVKMLRGAIYSLQAFKTACTDYGFHFSTNRFFTIGVDVNEYSGSLYQKEDEASAEELIETLHLAIGRVFEEKLRRLCGCYACRYDDCVYIIAAQRGDEALAAEELKKICRESMAVIGERYSVRISVYVSGVYSERDSGAMNIHDAFEETLWGLSQIKNFHEQETVMNRQDILNSAPAVDSARDDDTGSLHGEIVRYINEHYTDPNMNVASIADHLSFSSSYLLRAFKKRESCGILDYIHQRRVEEAKILLRTSAGGINAIAAKIGYTNALTFIRAFKRLEGVTPTTYRNLSQSHTV